MKLHRTLSAAAAIAAVGSVSLLASPVAHAQGDTPATGSAASVSATAEPSVTSGAPGEEGSTASERPDDGATAPERTGAKPSAATTPSGTPSPTYTRPDFCSGIPEEDRGKTELRGLPSEIVAGSGWHEFTYRVSNVSTVKLMETDVTLYLGTADPDIDDVSELSVTVEWFNPGSGAWTPVEGEGAEWDDNQDFATVGALEPGEYADARMRIRIAGDAKAGGGYFFTTGHSYGEDGQCGYDEISQFDFTVLPAGSEPGDVEEAEGKPSTGGGAGPGRGPAEGGKGGHAPQGGLAELPVSGKLAQTGASGALPATAAIGGAAVLAGAGAVFLVRRRRAATGE
ncbi:LPXTG cell wall anchor domain-containing protein [Streptomyces lycii]|uniref:LPXTG cell wall anchor domain-containing protein n=1 Tax=Streptomyces lycii TaxID=2654337 RepID=A0ABQ7FDN5_9ACTN|nr:LPXTG cell wall anchor domain-containing protein [Streptomyces lycii]KAF4406400.1 LPXTG cell wall anchor domain-containing protein [Streptomyces lycii]